MAGLLYMSRVQTGIEVLTKYFPKKVSNLRVGIVCNQASVDSELRHAIDLLQSVHAQVKIVFGPEHGMYGDIQDMQVVEDDFITHHSGTIIPVISLYRQSIQDLTPHVKHIQELDVLVVDLQDIGTRYYTFIWTMALCMQVAGTAGIRIIVCDRPNPINGVITEGNMLKPGFESFVGLYPLPNRHGLTLAEIARYLRDFCYISCDLEIIPMLGWKREMFFEDTGLPWVAPSPNIPTVSTALLYPGMCLVEATELSEGRGTCHPFEIAGAPGINPVTLAKALAQRNLRGCLFRPVYFRPTFHKYVGTRCGGIQIHITNRQHFKAYNVGTHLLYITRISVPELFTWRSKPYEFVTNLPAVDLLSGDQQLRLLIDNGTDPSTLEEEYEKELTSFEEIRRMVFLY